MRTGLDPAWSEDGILDWLCEGDPAVRWQTLRDLRATSAAELEAERTRMEREGWVARLLSQQLPNGEWPAPPGIPVRWRSTLEALMLLLEFQVDPRSHAIQRMLERLCSQVTWGAEFGNSPWFHGEVEPCINGRVLALGSAWGAPHDALAERLLVAQLADGGWNCAAPPSVRGSFHTTLCVLEGLLAYERAGACGAKCREARARGEAYLLKRGLFRSMRTGEVVDPAWLRLAFPNDWHYDILWALDYFRRSGRPPSRELTEAVELVRGMRDASGRWRRGALHEQDLDFPADAGLGEPSRWLTLRALRVLAWHDAALR